MPPPLPTRDEADAAVTAMKGKGGAVIGIVVIVLGALFAAAATESAETPALHAALMSLATGFAIFGGVLAAGSLLLDRLLEQPSPRS